MLDTTTGEVVNRTLMHEGNQVSALLSAGVAPDGAQGTALSHVISERHSTTHPHAFFLGSGARMCLSIGVASRAKRIPLETEGQPARQQVGGAVTSVKMTVCRASVAEVKLPNVPGHTLTADVVLYPPGGKSSVHDHAGCRTRLHTKFEPA